MILILDLDVHGARINGLAIEELSLLDGYLTSYDLVVITITGLIVVALLVGQVRERWERIV